MPKQGDSATWDIEIWLDKSGYIKKIIYLEVDGHGEHEPARTFHVEATFSGRGELNVIPVPE